MWADVQRQYQLARSPLGHGGQGEGLEGGEDGAVPLPIKDRTQEQNQEPQDSRRKVLPGEQGLGEGELLLCAGGRTQESTQVLLASSWL